MTKSYYVDPKIFYQEIVKSKAQDELTKEALKMIALIIENYSHKLRYRDEMDREDCTSNAILQILKNWRTFDPQQSTQAFAYFTQAAKMGLYNGWNKMYGYYQEGHHYSFDDLVTFQ